MCAQSTGWCGYEEDGCPFCKIRAKASSQISSRLHALKFSKDPLFESGGNVGQLSVGAENEQDEEVPKKETSGASAVKRKAESEAVKIEGEQAKPSSSTFAKSNFKYLYKAAKVPKDDLELLNALKDFVAIFCQQKGIPQVSVQAFIESLRKEALGIRLDGSKVDAGKVGERVDEMLDDIPRYAQRLWTSTSKLLDGSGEGPELCWMMNEAIRKDDTNMLQKLVTVIRAINSMCVTNRAPTTTTVQWPLDGRCFRGSGLPNEHRDFFAVGTKYRVPGYLATSFSESVALEFAERIFCRSEGEMPVVLWTILVDPEGAHNPQKRCRQVNYVTSSNLEEEADELEFLFAPYSVFTVVSVEWSPSSNYVQPHRISVRAAVDNLLENEELQLAPWY